jgi:hypothetical protein
MDKEELLGPINTHYESRHFKLEDVRKPELFRDMFP